MCDKRDRAVTCVFCRDLHRTFKFSGLKQKDVLKRRWSLTESFFQTKLLSRLSHSVCRLLSFPVFLFSVSSLLARDGDSEGGDSHNVMKRHFEQNRDYSHSLQFLDTVIRFRKRENHSLSWVESHKQIYVVIEQWKPESNLCGERGMGGGEIRTFQLACLF